MGRCRFLINNYAKFSATAEYDIHAKLDSNTKKSILKAASSVVCLKSYSGDKELFMCSGFIMECDSGCDSFEGIIWTSATLLRCSSGANMVADDVKVGIYMAGGTFYEGEVLAFDFHYNIAVIKINSDISLSTSTARLIDTSFNSCTEDSISTNRFRLSPEDEVLALGRYFDDTYEIMVELGEFSRDRCSFDCKELCNASCKIKKNGIGGPLINRFGEVIGLNFYNAFYTPFLPINIASKCFADLKKYGQIQRPWIGVNAIDLYSERLSVLEKLYKKFPHVVKGALVQKVLRNSPASAAGLLAGDVIVNCDGNLVGSCLELTEALWDKESKPVELVVVRASLDEPLNLPIEAVETNPKEYKWPIPDLMYHVPPFQGRIW